MRRLIIGMCLIGNLIINVAMLITLVILVYLEHNLFDVHSEKAVSFVAFVVSCLLSIYLAFWFKRLSKKQKVPAKLKGIFKKFAEELNAIDTMYSCYIETDNESKKEETDYQVRMESMSEMFEKLGDLPDEKDI